MTTGDAANVKMRFDLSFVQMAADGKLYAGQSGAAPGEDPGLSGSDHEVPDQVRDIQEPSAALHSSHGTRCD